MNNEYAIEVDDLVIRYREMKKYSIKENLFKFKKPKAEEFEAVSHVSFKVKKGEILGIIGKNGCGKSTMLKAIGGIFAPDCGSIDTKDNSISLLAIGIGFNKEMTGRANIYLSGMLLGFTEEQIRAKEEEIVAFADIDRFIDKPVRTYSSGMHSKLAFAITANLETDIMLVDEVLSVGDQKFKKKSAAKMRELISAKDRTVVIVSHNIATLMDLCDTIMWMHDGKIVKMGDPKEVLTEYQEFMEK